MWNLPCGFIYEQYAITLDFIKVENFTSPITLRAHEVLQTVYLKFHPNASNLHFTTELRLHTNASIFNIPIVVYNGRLKVNKSYLL